MVVEPSPNRYNYNTTPQPMAQGLLWKRKQKDPKSQRIREFTVRLCLLGLVEVTPFLNCVLFLL